ncbi:MAG: DUF1330 domain-containing protein [Gammaproteobacteria bacterium]|jgi:uncharacterized protein (DUF1330 family)|nr:DUF1330 domain-containing protein [Gammaproteobacteria bacterium]
MNKHNLSRRQFLGSSSAAGLAIATGLGVTQSANAHVVEINAISPTQEQLQEFLALPERPVVMVNLLKFKPGGGAAEYAKYSAGVGPLLEKVGARIIFSSTTAMCLLGNGDWDAIALVEYPRPAALLQMSSSPEYQAIAGFRQDGLAGQINYAVWQNA